MEKNSSSKQYYSSYSSSSSSSYSASMIAELFGPRESSPSTTTRSSSSPSSYSHSSSSSSPSSASSSSIFGSVFGPSSMGGGRDSTRHAGSLKHNVPENWSQNINGESGRSSYYQQETVDQPCNFSSSIYYGGQEVYSPTTRPNDSHLTFKKDEKDDDDHESASRGNWWQGSLYY